MSIKFVLAISLFCCVFLAPINGQSQEYDDQKFREAKERDKYKPTVPLPTRRPQDQQPNGPRNPQQGGGNKPTRVGSQTTPRPQNQSQDNPRNQNNRPQNSPQSQPLFYYVRYQRQELEQHSNCMRIQKQGFRVDYQMNSLAADIPDNRRPPQS